MSTEWEDSSGEIQDIDIPINLDFPNTKIDLLYTMKSGTLFIMDKVGLIILQFTIWISLRKYYIKKIIDYNDDQGFKNMLKNKNVY